VDQAFLGVCKFETAVGNKLSTGRPCEPDLKTVQLRKTLIAEEHKEVQDALTVVEEAIVNGELVTPEMLVEVADGCADLRFVCNGTDVAFGVDGPAVDKEVGRANLSKFDGQHWYDETGKLRKSPNFVPPDVLGVLIAQKPLNETYGPAMKPKHTKDKSVTLTFTGEDAHAIELAAAYLRRDVSRFADWLDAQIIAEIARLKVDAYEASEDDEDFEPMFDDEGDFD
jgi:predicted HAD superfamily Cof-like phosphohydrolase